MAAGHAEQAQLGAARLAGLGGGLTPAGADLVVGVCLAAWAGLFGAGTAALCPGLAATVAAQTTTLSAAYVTAAARGECAHHWHQLFDALTDRSDSALRAATRSLLAVGHTSGADALAGFILSLRRTP
jgi:hypothetical protein